jgi:hypothetical protein
VDSPHCAAPGLEASLRADAARFSRSLTLAGFSRTEQEQFAFVPQVQLRSQACMP